MNFWRFKKNGAAETADSAAAAVYTDDRNIAAARIDADEQNTEKHNAAAADFSGSAENVSESETCAKDVAAAVAETASDTENGIEISVKNCNLWYGKFHALKDVNIEIPAKKVTAFIGPSGCGKSTFLKILNRMNDLVEGCRVEGSFTIGGKDIFSKQTDVNELRKNVGMVFQTPNPFPMSVYDNITFAPRTFGIRKKAELDEIVETSLRRAGIWDEVKDRLKKSALGLSGGQQQRLCIARALAAEPEILLMDEPTSALDPISTGKIEELIGELKDSLTIVIVTHNMQQATRVSDKTAFFLLGELVEYGDTEQIFSCPADKRTENYITGRFG